MQEEEKTASYIQLDCDVLALLSCEIFDSLWPEVVISQQSGGRFF